MKEKRFTFTIPKEMDEDIEQLSHEKSCSKADVIRMAVATFIATEEVEKEIIKNKINLGGKIND